MMTFLGTTMFNKPPRQVTNSNLSFFFAIRIRRCTYLGNREHRTYLPRYAKLLQKATSFYNINLFILIKKRSYQLSNWHWKHQIIHLIYAIVSWSLPLTCVNLSKVALGIVEKNLQMPRNLDDNKKLIPPVEYQYSGRENTSYSEIPL